MSNWLREATELAPSSRKKIIIRDEQISWIEAMDLAQYLSRLKRKLILIDTGCFSLPELEWLIKRKVILVSYPEANRSWADLLLLKKVADRFNCPLIFACRDADLEKGDRKGEDFLFAMRILARGGIDLHLSGRKGIIEPESLIQLAANCRLGCSWFVYYHYDYPHFWLSQLAKEKAWIHLDGRFLEDNHGSSLEEILRSFPRGKVQLVLHLEEEDEKFNLMELVEKYRGYIVFSSPSLISLKRGRYLREPILPFRSYHLEPRALF